MKPHASFGILAAAASLVLLVSEIALAQTTGNSPTNQQQTKAGVEASDMVRAQAALDHSLDARKAKPGDEFQARLTDKVHLKNGTELPAGTELIGKIGTDDMQQSGQSKLALSIDQAKLKDGKTLPVKATIVGVYGPGAGSAAPYPVVPGDQVSNDWTRGIHRVDQRDAFSGVDLHSSLTSRNSAVLVSTKKDDIKLKMGTELALALAPQQSAQSATMR